MGFYTPPRDELYDWLDALYDFEDLVFVSTGTGSKFENDYLVNTFDQIWDIRAFERRVVWRGLLFAGGKKTVAEVRKLLRSLATGTAEKKRAIEIDVNVTPFEKVVEIIVEELELTPSKYFVIKKKTIEEIEAGNN